MRLILLGAPGAGKGTQAEILSMKLNVATISTGNILRAAIRSGTQIGRMAMEYIEKGDLVPDEIIIGILKEGIQKFGSPEGYILDGVPRTIAQAEIMEDEGIIIDKALSIEIDDETIIDRMSGRRTCKNCSASYHILHNPPQAEGVCDKCGGILELRTDDEPETVIRRLGHYHRETEPLKAYYQERGKLVSVENRPTVAETTAEILKVLGL